MTHTSIANDARIETLRPGRLETRRRRRVPLALSAKSPWLALPAKSAKSPPETPRGVLPRVDDGAREHPRGVVVRHERLRPKRQLQLHAREPRAGACCESVSRPSGRTPVRTGARSPRNEARSSSCAFEFAFAFACSPPSRLPRGRLRPIPPPPPEERAQFAREPARVLARRGAPPRAPPSTSRSPNPIPPRRRSRRPCTSTCSRGRATVGDASSRPSSSLIAASMCSIARPRRRRGRRRARAVGVAGEGFVVGSAEEPSTRARARPRRGEAARVPRECSRDVRRPPPERAPRRRAGRRRRAAR